MAAAPQCAAIDKYDQYDKVECQGLLAVRDIEIEQKDAEIQRLRNVVASIAASRDHYVARAAKFSEELAEQERQSQALRDSGQ